MTEEEALRRSQRTWYLPHHVVFHPQKQGKIRVVFDAASLHDGVSLNNQLLQGPDLTNNLLGILLRFRKYPIALVALGGRGVLARCSNVWRSTRQ